MFTRLVSAAGVGAHEVGEWVIGPGRLAEATYDPDYNLSARFTADGALLPSGEGPTVRPDGCISLHSSGQPPGAVLSATDAAVASMWLAEHKSHYPYTAADAACVRTALAQVPRPELRPLVLTPTLLTEPHVVMPRWGTEEPALLYWDDHGQWVCSLDGQWLDRVSPVTHPDVHGAALLVEADAKGDLWVLDCLAFDGLVIDAPRARWGTPSSEASTIRDRLVQAERVQAAYQLIRTADQPQLWLHRCRSFQTADELAPLVEGVRRLEPTAGEVWIAPARRGPVYRISLLDPLVDSLCGTGYQLLGQTWATIDETLFQSLGTGEAITIFCLPADAERYQRLAAGFRSVHLVTSPSTAMPLAPVVAIFATWLWESPEVWAAYWAQPRPTAITVIFRCWDGPTCWQTFRPLTGVSREAVVFTEGLAATAWAGKPLPPAGLQWRDGWLNVSIPGLVPAGSYALGWPSDLTTLGPVGASEQHQVQNDFFSQKERWLSKLQRWGRLDLDMSRPQLRRSSPPEVTTLGPYARRADSEERPGPHNARPYRTAYTYVRQNSIPDRYVSIPHNEYVLPLLPVLLDNRIEQVGAQWYKPVYRLATVADGTCLIHSVLQAAVPEYQEKENKERAAMGKSVRRGLGLLLEQPAPESGDAKERVYTYADGGANQSVYESAAGDTKSALYQEVKLFSLPGLQALYRSDAFLGSETLAYLSYVFGVVIHQFVGYGKFGLRDHIVYQTTAYQPRKHIAIVGLGSHFETLAVLRNGYLVTVFDDDDEFLTSIPAPSKV